MSENPFGALGEGGGFDMNALIQQAQQMQSQLETAQQRLQELSVEGAAGGVTVSMSGTGELTGVTIAPGQFDGANAEDLADLGDLIVAAARDARAKVDEAAAETMGPLAGGLGGLGG